MNDPSALVTNDSVAVTGPAIAPASSPTSLTMMSVLPPATRVLIGVSSSE
jgi:hypothetical protein